MGRGTAPAVPPGPAAFQAVVVSVAAGPPGPGGEVTFVTWATCAVRLADERDVVVEALGANGAVEKTLGCLTRASAVVSDEQGRTLDVRTEGADLGTSLYRFKFASLGDAAAFADIADAVLKEECEERQRSREARERQQKELEEAIRAKFSASRPVVFRGVQLFGAQPGEAPSVEGGVEDEGGVGDEVLLGEGAG